MTYLQQLAAEARPINDADYGSERQIEAENFFFETLDLHTSHLSIKVREAFDTYCARATTDERITEGLRLAEMATEV